MSVKRGGLTLLMFGVALGSAAPAHAQPYDPAIDINLFEYAIGPKSFVTVQDADVARKNQFSVDFLLTFLTKPFSIFDVDENGNEITGTRTNVVENMLAGQLSGAYGVNDELTLGGSMPLIFSLRGEGLDPATGSPPMGESLSASGIGDIRGYAKYLLWRKDAMRLSGIGALTIPTSFGTGGNDFLGDDLPSVRAGGAFQWSHPNGKLSAGANLGLILRKPRTIYSSKVGQQIAWGGAGAYKLNDRVSAIGELFGRIGVTNADLASNPLEAGAAVRVQATHAVSVLVGGGGGLVRGIGSPGMRVFASVGWAPDTSDDDNDGIPNHRDKCPLVPEDRDGFEDTDGCPDNDNDGDKRDDSTDKCPNQPEDFDGFEDDDGCPELDNDKDGIKDLDDRCPNDAEDKKAPFPDDGCPANKRDSDADGVFDDKDRCPKEAEDPDGFEDWDGCPDADNDKDGIPDDKDKCALCPEDKDGFADADGCPDFDNDGDGIADAKDQCPLKAESINGIDDFDGCPDTGGRQLVAMNGDRLVVAVRPAFRRANLTRPGKMMVDQIAVLMLQQRDVTKWMLVVAAPRVRDDATTRRLSQLHADKIKAALVARGIPEANIQAVGALSATPKTGLVVRERGAAAEGNEFACPGIKAVPRSPQDATPATPEPSTEVKSKQPDATKPDPDATSKPPLPAPAPAPEVIPDVFKPYEGISRRIKFRRSRTRLARGKKTLRAIAALLKQHPNVMVEIATHTDSRKGKSRSKFITQGQAETAKKYLIEHGVNPDQISAVGHGMDNPIASNKRSRGRAKNRRVELTFSIKK